jgi:hypothetical protein
VFGAARLDPGAPLLPPAVPAVAEGASPVWIGRVLFVVSIRPPRAAAAPGTLLPGALAAPAVPAVPFAVWAEAFVFAVWALAFATLAVCAFVAFAVALPLALGCAVPFVPAPAAPVPVPVPPVAVPPDCAHANGAAPARTTAATRIRSFPYAIACSSRERMRLA